MPELPEVEITARRLHRALAGARVESALAPGMVTMKTFDPPLSALAGATVTGVRRTGKMPVVELGDLALLVHLMSAGRLQLFDKRASLRDKASRLLIRLDDGRELRLREFGTRQRAWAKLLRVADVARDEAVATLGPEAWPAPPPADDFLDRTVILGPGKSGVVPPAPEAPKPAKAPEPPPPADPDAGIDLEKTVIIKAPPDGGKFRRHGR